MMSSKMAALGAAVCCIVILASSESSAAAVSWEKGEEWVYSLWTELEVPVLGTLNLTGSLTYELSRQTTWNVNGTDFEVNVMDVSGDAMALRSYYGLTLTVAAVFGGELVVLRDSLAVVSDNLRMWANATFGEEPFAYTYSYGNEITTAYSPPLLSGFVPGTTLPGSQWNETIAVTSGSREWANDSAPTYMNSTSVINYTCTAQNGVAETNAGTYDTLLIIESSAEMDTRVESHYSEELENFVLINRFSPADATQPYMKLSLESYSTPSGLMLYLIVGVAAAAVAVVAVVIMLRSRRSAKQR
jgi:hypothetical protein